MWQEPKMLVTVHCSCLHADQYKPELQVPEKGMLYGPQAALSFAM